MTVRVGVDGEAEEWVDQPIRVIDLPEEALVALIRRGGQGIIPKGATVVERGDHLTVIGSPAAVRTLSTRLRDGRASRREASEPAEV